MKNGKKNDDEKIRLGEVLHNFSRAIIEVGKAGTYGAKKYSMDNFGQVSDSVNRYTNAMYRHLFAEANGEKLDKEWGLLHATHAAWNALARLEMILREMPEEKSLFEKHKRIKKSEVEVFSTLQGYKNDENVVEQLKDITERSENNERV